MAKAKPFFPESADFSERVTDLYDFVWPTAAAVWNLRWQVQGFLAVQPNASKTLLHARFVEGSGIRGENLEQACMRTDWEHQQEHFARILLVNLFAHYESWCTSIRDKFNAPKHVDKDLQFWERDNGQGNIVLCFVDAVKTMSLQHSVPMASAFGAVYKNSHHYSWAHLESMVRCLRFFKELRNCIAHHGALASSRLVDAHTAWQPLATPEHLGEKEVPRHAVPLVGQPCNVDLRGVVGFGSVLLRIVATVDASLVGTKQAEVSFEERWNEHVRLLKLKPSNKSAKKQIRSEAAKMGIVQPDVTEIFLEYLRDRSLTTDSIKETG